MSGLGPTAIAKAMEHIRPGLLARNVSSRLSKHGVTPLNSGYRGERDDRLRRAVRGEIDIRQAVKEEIDIHRGEFGWPDRDYTWLNLEFQRRIKQLAYIDDLRVHIPQDPDKLPEWRAALLEETAKNAERQRRVFVHEVLSIPQRHEVQKKLDTIHSELTLLLDAMTKGCVCTTITLDHDWGYRVGNLVKMLEANNDEIPEDT